jgi:hypothetical protein
MEKNEDTPACIIELPYCLHNVISIKSVDFFAQSFVICTCLVVPFSYLTVSTDIKRCVYSNKYNFKLYNLLLGFFIITGSKNIFKKQIQAKKKSLSQLMYKIKLILCYTRFRVGLIQKKFPLILI